jgi:hypothetical protein
MKDWPTWLLVSMVFFCFPVLLWLSQVTPAGLEFIKVLNDTQVEWNLPNIQSALGFTALFTAIGAVALPTFVFSAACTTILVNRMIGDKG